MAIGFTNISNGGGVKGLSAHPQDVRMGMTYSVDGKTAETGTMNLTNLLPENIRKGVNIAGVVGTANALNSGIIKEIVVEHPMVRVLNFEAQKMELTFLDIPPYSIGLSIIEGHFNFHVNSGAGRAIFGIANKFNLNRRIELNMALEYFYDERLSYLSGVFQFFDLCFLTNGTNQLIQAKYFEDAHLRFENHSGYEPLDITQPMTMVIRRYSDSNINHAYGHWSLYNNNKQTFKVKYYILDI